MPMADSNNYGSGYHDTYPNAPPAYSQSSGSYDNQSSGNYPSNMSSQLNKPNTYPDQQQEYRQPSPQPRMMEQQPQQYSNFANTSRAFISNLPLKQGGLLGALLTGPGQQQRRPLDPPPECFSRAPQYYQQPSPFSPVQIPCAGPRLDAGFPMMYPGYALSSHDVPEEDWIRFIQDIAISARYGTGQNIQTSGIQGGGFGGRRGLVGMMGSQFSTPGGSTRQAASLVDVWNNYYFNQRGVNMTLMHGPFPITGPNSYQGLDSISDDEDNGEESLKDYALGALIDVKERRRQKNMKKQMKQDKKDQRKNPGAFMRTQQPYFLLIEYRQY
ncbi:hypothetical protein INT44_002824 [Umbelopsis vinacea]|uniref:Uncharacterized protein n=1 Tax=Umbelopsis vinacea TaxID=44442 RepID=A0A8H7Q786_9FUNG|nr:hypothetical protein INT44_002824 [Umbelopsis vinacea]